MSLTQIDYFVFKAINDTAGSLPFIDGIMRFLSQDAEYLFYLGIILYWFTRKRENRKMVMESLVSACLAFGIGMIVSHLVYRDRPFVTHHVHKLIDHAANASFPSDHSIGAFVIATAIWLFRKKAGFIWLLLAAFISLSRIWNGVHYPFDVITGALLGVLSAVVVHLTFMKIPFARSVMAVGIALYESIEQRIWPSRNEKAAKS
ncbi:undecaprenyl-diphosphatase [Paenibacillus alginolyticus]|uniref:undecaprenyl-diphosphatase n=1 Tax=Paenibacillus alginolyticus TaxID=59839 RepID=UPI00042613E7|nr:undecaprenyl-diphosphatase [Paenibacillus alginolyticus]MCY9667401.1 undecaprenyl-diphosphatase [Paenibacillus alginolyticus]